MEYNMSFFHITSCILIWESRVDTECDMEKTIDILYVIYLCHFYVIIQILVYGYYNLRFPELDERNLCCKNIYGGWSAQGML